MRYSLTDYILSVKIPDELRDVFINSNDTIDESANRISIGGDGSYVGSIKTSLANDQWSTEGDATGSWIHSKNKSRVGTISLDINQLSDVVLKLTRLIETYYSADTITNGLTLTISKAIGNGNSVDVCTATDCYLKKQPDGDWEDTAKSMTFDFTCGKVVYSGDAM